VGRTLFGATETAAPWRADRYRPTPAHRARRSARRAAAVAAAAAGTGAAPRRLPAGGRRGAKRAAPAARRARAPATRGGQRGVWAPRRAPAGARAAPPAAFVAVPAARGRTIAGGGAAGGAKTARGRPFLLAPLQRPRMLRWIEDWARPIALSLSIVDTWNLSHAAPPLFIDTGTARCASAGRQRREHRAVALHRPDPVAVAVCPSLLQPTAR